MTHEQFEKAEPIIKEIAIVKRQIYCWQHGIMNLIRLQVDRQDHYAELDCVDKETVQFMAVAQLNKKLTKLMIELDKI